MSSWSVRFRPHATPDRESGADGLPKEMAWEMYRKLQEKVRAEGGEVEIFEGKESKGRLVCLPGERMR